MKLISALIAAFLSAPALAGPASLTYAGVAELRELVANDPTAKHLFSKFQRVADGSLGLTPTPIAQVISEGRLAKDPEKIATGRAAQDLDRIEALGWAAVVTRDERYANKAKEFILAWARVNKADGNPINETRFEPVVEAYDLLREKFSPEEQKVVDAWLEEKARQLWASTRHRDMNWQSQRLKMVGLIGLTLQDTKLWSTATEGFKAQILDNFEPSGASIDFTLRDAIHYHVYAVQPLVTLACAASQRGEDIFTYKAADGSTLRSAVDFVLPYAEGKKQHVEFANTRVLFDKKRAAAGETKYEPHVWDPKKSVDFFAEAGCLDKGYEKTALELAQKKGRFATWRMVLNSAMRKN